MKFQNTIIVLNLLLLLNGLQLKAQSSCGTSLLADLQFSKQTITSTSNHKLTTENAVDTLDLVFHIMHTGEPIGQKTNITTAQIESAVLSLNRDFGAWPIHDSIAIRPNGVNTQFYFRLACLDPNGKATSGINRINASSITNYSTEGFHFLPNNQGNNTDLTALSDWDVTKYINIWVTHRIETPKGDLSNGGGFGANLTKLTQGFSGVYATAEVVGCDPDGSLSYQITNPYGKILSHEIGHYLGLHHTFEGATCKESDCTTEGDLVCDTEPHDNSISVLQHPGCDEYTECGTREPIENLMNYAGSTCGNTFTQGQKDRMKAMVALHFQNVVNKGQCGKQISNATIKNSTDLIKIHPNPSSGNVVVQLMENSFVELVSINGMVLFSKSMSKGANNISLLSFPKGVYFFRIHSNANTVVKKIVLQN